MKFICSQVYFLSAPSASIRMGHRMFHRNPEPKIVPPTVRERKEKTNEEEAPALKKNRLHSNARFVFSF